MLARILIVLIGCLGSTSSFATTPPTKEVSAFLKEHCNKCHNEKKHKGDLRLDNLVVDFTSPKIMGHWEESMNRINSGDMPPDDEPRPKPEDINAVADWIAGQLREAEAARQATGADKVAFLKLSREEYANTICDLLGVTFDPKGAAGLPEDPDWKGFERIGSVLTLSPAHVEKYLAAAEMVLDEALSLRPEPKRENLVWTAWDMRWKDHKKEYEARGIADQVRIEIVPNNYTTDTWNLEVKTTGDYILRVKLSGLRAQGGRAPRLKVYLSNVDKTLIEQDVDTAEDKPITIEKRVHLLAGKYPVRIINSVPGPNPEGRRSRHSGTPNAFTTTRSRVPWQLKLTDDDFKPIQPTLIVDRVEWDGPIVDSWPTGTHQKIFASKDAREIVSKFAERAWRRPVRDEEVNRLVKLFEKAQSLGENFEGAVKTALVAVLSSKSFIYLEEGNTKQHAPTLSDWELASRLSYFLWSTMPDERLIELARSSTLKQNLAAEVKRMLADPKAKAFGDGFPRQWLQLRKVGMFPPDKVLYPDYDDNLEHSMVAETVGFFTEVLHRNGSLRDFLDSDWTMLNERLAMHYELQELFAQAKKDEETRRQGDTETGTAHKNGLSASPRLPVSASSASLSASSEFIRVTLPRDSHRGGLLTQGSVLSLTSDGTRHRPVHRGVWLLDAIIGKPAPPPPANVPALSTPDAKTKKTTVREKLEAHRADPNCNACHTKIDPLGIAFDNYDAIGRWRTVETVKDGTGEDPKLDASGTLSDGRQFSGPEELKHILLSDLDKFASAVTEKLATYALRRGMTFSDREELKHIVEKAKGEDYKLASLIESLVTSPLFVKR